jgi:hypothetical protein
MTVYGDSVKERPKLMGIPTHISRDMSRPLGRSQLNPRGFAFARTQTLGFVEDALA